MSNDFDLTPKIQRKRTSDASESAALRGLCATLNAGFTAPGGADARTQAEIKNALKAPAPQPVAANAAQAATLGLGAVKKPAPVPEDPQIPPTPLPTAEATQEVFPTRHAEPDIASAPVSEAEEESAPAVSRSPLMKIAFTGRLKSGKDYCAQAAGCKILSFADPLYGLLELFFGVTQDRKDVPGGRKFMQQVGTWGRGVIDEEHPVTPERAVFTQMIRAMAMADSPLPFKDHVNWVDFGLDENIWLDALVSRSHVDGDPPRFGVVNVRFENELKKLDSAGWTRFHVLVSTQTLQQRWRNSGVTPAAANHYSEKLAATLDKQCIQLAKTTRKPKINVIWSDPYVKCPSNKFYTVEEFAARVRGKV